MAEPESTHPTQARRARWSRIAFAGGVLLAVGLAISQMPEEPPPPPPDPAPEEVAMEEPAEPPGVRTATSPDAPLPPSGRLELSRDALPAAGPLVVHLALGEPSRDDAPSPVRIIGQPGPRVLALEGRLSSDRRVTAIELDPAFLVPGSYLVDVRTTERSHFPVRRYVIVVEE